ncbi:CinA family nicotinamide mononucleotide deamidase-related protein [Dysgonomonas sp. Marseille-P4677]|uniref:CinA family nicotinamide mononucleotide deamidase-related protein n=1 Tax=Dysgonomonas sp. Marseille-P4677 TaxID=2364790 RepID=UPI0019121C3F|nr:CinA family nicotinamide mononucleotide deamidase-related protein [Dysgonomonas sp. Marseille-P4677]MBK5722718.1 CinA family nicotinamide mononucleotide deamidase-related protein [Dysgonomonas sp. Marseille-P4677]
MKAAIVTIGDEILIGQIVDTNSAWIAEKLTLAGFEVQEMLSIGDDAQQIKATIDDVFTRVDVILMTGGLGPTKDDITKKTLCDYFGTTLVFDDSVLENIQNVISSFTSLNELTRNQAYVPKNCTVIQNRVGTAPITWFDYMGKVLVSMPGVPYEMRYVMENEIMPRLQAKYDPDAYLKRVFIVRGYTESALAMYIADFENNLPDGFGLAYLPSPGLMKLRLFVRGEHRLQEMNEQVRRLTMLLDDAIIAESDITVENILGERLFEKGLTLGTAESCTGGKIAHLITSVPGASRYFKGSVISYANEEKVNILHVSQDSLDRFGAVSETVAIEMAKGAQQALNVDCSIATTGIAGPDGGTDDKPVGTVWICTTYKDKCVTKKYQLGKFREANIMRASNNGLLQLLAMIE